MERLHVDAIPSLRADGWRADDCVRVAFCTSFTVGLILTNRSRARFYALTSKYCAALGPPAGKSGWFDSLQNVDQPGRLPLVGGWPRLSWRSYVLLTRSHALEAKVEESEWRQRQARVLAEGEGTWEGEVQAK